ncbi:hypothetical protein H0H93_001504 [Arthromyces matolae]|nr:hypothetical protein H0H93_001504 [Arthromyces matolae]
MALIFAVTPSVNGTILILKSCRDLSLGKVEIKASRANVSVSRSCPPLLDDSTCRNRTNLALWELDSNVPSKLMEDHQLESNRMDVYSIRSASDWNALFINAKE